jgi:hypothetical protein
VGTVLLCPPVYRAGKQYRGLPAMALSSLFATGYFFHHLADVGQTSASLWIFSSAIAPAGFLFECNPFKNQ